MNQVETKSHRELQQRLMENHRARLRPALPDDDWQLDLSHELRARAERLEWLERERAAVESRAAAAPTDAEAFVRWFEDLKVRGPGQGDPLFPWLEREADAGSMRWFLLQEFAGEAGFDDLVALTQVKLPDRAKLEMARNYWDEMGRGAERGMHGPMLAQTARELGVDAAAEADQVITPALSLANLMTGLALERRYAFHSVGALGAIELTAPGRAAMVYRGLQRVGISAAGTRYYLLHSTLDVKHSEAWNAEVLAPLVAEDPRRAHAIAEGALMRLEAGARCYRAYRWHLGLIDESAAGDAGMFIAA